MAGRPIYLDAHATTPLDPRVLDAMRPFLTEAFGNAASRNHAYGWEAADAVEEAREKVAAAIGASPKEIVWTSGATESDNLAILGAAEAAGAPAPVVTTAIEHPAVLDPARHLASRGHGVVIVPVGASGVVDPAAVEEALAPDTAIVSVMAANNEVGTIQPVREIGRLVKGRSAALFHTDAVQAVGWLALDVEEDGIDLLSISGHKIHGPKGVGALYVRRRRPTVRLAPRVFGGGHERGLRSGTLNVPGIVGLGAAIELAVAARGEESRRVAALRDALLGRLLDALPDVVVNGDRERRLPNNLNVSFRGVEAEDLLRAIPDVAVSTGAACSSASLEPSHVLRALGLSDARAQSSIRFGLTRLTTAEEVERAAADVVDAVRRLRAGAALPE